MLTRATHQAWRLLASAIHWLTPGTRPPRVSRLSDDWLRQHERDAAKHPAPR
jgi:hypothetical protein